MGKNRPRVLIEQWLPIDQIGAECMRERGASSALPPLYFLHVWWARRPLTVSRAAILASLLPAYPTGDDDDIRPWPKTHLKQFPNFEAYQRWFLGLIGIKGDAAAAKRVIEHEKITGKRTPGNKYGYPRAFFHNPSEEQSETLYSLLEWTWGQTDIKFCDPMSGGGSIPFEALRIGLTVHANELNPIASVILKGTLDYPARYGEHIAARLRPYCEQWSQEVRSLMSPFYPSHPQTNDGSLKGGSHVWARTIACPTTGKPIPLSPHWWLLRTGTYLAVKVIAAPELERCRFEIVRGKTECEKLHPERGTVKRGTAVSPWTGEAIDGDYIKREAQAGRMGQQLYAIEVFCDGLDFRAPTPEDERIHDNAVAEFERRHSELEAKDYLPTEPRREGRADWACKIYGMSQWRDTYTLRQLLSMATMIEVAHCVLKSADDDCAAGRITAKEREALATVFGLTIGKAADYNSKQTTWDVTRTKIAHAFGRHDLSMRWSFGEFDASRNFAPWVVEQVLDALKGMGRLAFERDIFGTQEEKPVDRLHLTTGPAQSLSMIGDGTIRIICVDPPYYDNVNYAECSNYFYVWTKRMLRGTFPELFSSELVNADDEAIMNIARFKEMGRKAKELAIRDYENKMAACFTEMYRVLSDDGVLTVMFNHKQVVAWDTLGSSLVRAGFQIDSSWPIHTESEVSLHQARKNAAASTILLVCRKRPEATESVWWDDLKARVRLTAREKAAKFERQGIKGVDLYISTFGPVLSVISENWPVLTSETDPKTGDPLPLKPGEALDLAREEVINLRKRGLLLGRTVEFDPVTDWYLMAWDAFRAQEFPADEARKLALALGLDLERDVIRDKKLVSKKSGTVALCKPADRRKRNMVDADADSFPHLIDVLHTAMMIYDEEGSKACQVFIDRQGLRNDSRLKSLVQAMMEAIPTTRGKDGKFLRPEMTTLDAMRILFWEDLPAPKEEEAPKLDPQIKFAGFEDGEEEEEDRESENDE